LAGDKTEKASPKKRRDERKKGNVFKSQDIVTVVSLLGSFCSLRFLFPVIYESTVSYAKKCIAGVGELKDFQALGGGYYLRDLLFQFIKSSLPLLLVAVFMAALGVGSQTKFLFTMKNAMPKFSRLNPIGGIRKIISLKSVVELSKSLIKIIVLLSVLYQFLKRCLPFVTASLNISSLGAASSLLQYIYSMILKVVMWFGVIAAFDFLYQWWDYERQLMMSKQEMKEEYKQQEGDPQIKGRIRNLQRMRAKQRMMQAVPTADVVIRNPTHVAVALKYDISSDRAPILVAKGVDHTALKIVEVAMDSHVEVIENVSVARAESGDTTGALWYRGGFDDLYLSIKREERIDEYETNIEQCDFFFCSGNRIAIAYPTSSFCPGYDDYI